MPNESLAIFVYVVGLDGLNGCDYLYTAIFSLEKCPYFGRFSIIERQSRLKASSRFQPWLLVYHYSQTLKAGDCLELGHLDFTDLCEPFMQALTHGRDCFFGMLLNGKYMFAVLNRSNLRYWADYAKWATEGLFEYVRRTEYPQCVSRLKCHYFCADLNDCIRMFNEDWSEEDEEERNNHPPA